MDSNEVEHKRILLAELVRRQHTCARSPPRQVCRSIITAGGCPRGEYRSRKVLFFLFNQADESPEYIVKMTRDPSLNPRLENEYRAGMAG